MTIVARHVRARNIHALFACIATAATVIIYTQGNDDSTSSNSLLHTLCADGLARIRKPSRTRFRVTFQIIVSNLSDAEFRRAFRVSKTSFQRLLNALSLALDRDVNQARRSSGGEVESAVRLAVTLRMLAGGSYHDQMLSFNLGRSTVFQIFHDTISAIVKTLKMPGVPLHDVDKLMELSTRFNESRQNPSPLFGCVGALDGISIAIQKPPDEYVPRNFYCRKGMYAMPVQAIVDSRYRFLYMSCRCVGSTHDSVAFHVSSMARRLRQGEMPAGY